MSKFAIGFHYFIGGNKNGSGQFIEKLNAAGIPVMIKGASDAGLCFEAQETGKKYGVENLLVWRATSGREDRADYWLAPSEAAAKKWSEIKGLWPPELDPARVWWEAINEPRKEDAPDEVQPTWGNMHTTAWLGLFLVELARLMNAAGYKICGPSFSSGEPEPEDWQLAGMGSWLRYCADHPEQAAVTAHEYNYGNVPFLDNYPWHYGRFESVIAAADRLGIPRTFKIFLTEMGWQERNVPSFETAVPVLTQYARLAAKFPQLAGLALWTLGAGWGDISNQLAAWIGNQGNPLASWVINNQYPELTQPQATAAEFGATLPEELPPDGGGGEPVTTEIKSTVTYGAIEGRIKVRPQKWDGTLKNWVATGPAIYLDLPAGTRRIAIDDEIEVDEPSNPNPPQPKPYLEVEALGQRDARWAGVVLGQPTGHDKTIGNWGCLLVAYNCLARYWGLTTRLPDAENAHYVSAGAFSAQYIQPAALRTAYPDAVVYDGYLTRDSAAMRPKIREWLDKGWPVPCRVDFSPATAQWEQHWVLIVGYVGETDFWMADPWHGDIAIVNSRYAIAGSDVLEAIFYHPEQEPPGQPDPPAGQTYDLLSYLRGPDKIQYDTDGKTFTQTYQYRHEGDAWRLVKGGNGQYEFLYADDRFIYRREDTSQGNDRFYVHYTAGKAGAPWVKRYMAVGETAVFFKDVVHYWNNCTVRIPKTAVTDSIRLNAVYSSYTFPGTGKTLANVAELEWLQGGERYWFAQGFGLVGFTDGPITAEFMGGPLQGRADLPIYQPGCLDLSGRYYG